MEVIKESLKTIFKDFEEQDNLCQVVNENIFKFNGELTPNFTNSTDDLEKSIFIPFYGFFSTYKKEFSYKCNSLQINYQKKANSIEKFSVYYEKIEIKTKENNFIEMNKIEISYDKNSLIYNVDLIYTQSKLEFVVGIFIDFFESKLYDIFFNKIQFELLLNSVHKYILYVKVNNLNKEKTYKEYHIKISKFLNNQEYKITRKSIIIEYDKTKRKMKSSHNILIKVHPRDLYTMFLENKTILKQLLISFIHKPNPIYSSFDIPMLIISLRTIPTIPLIDVTLTQNHFELSEGIVTTKLTSSIYNPLSQEVVPITKNLTVSFNIHNHSIHFDNCYLNLTSLLSNLITNALIDFNYDFYPSIKNCTSNVLEVNYFNRKFYLSPNSSSYIFYKSFSVILNINDKEYIANIDITRVFIKYFSQDIYTPPKEQSNLLYKNEIVDYIKFDMVSQDNAKRSFYLFFLIKRSNKTKINLYIHDDLIIFHKYPNTYSLLHYISYFSGLREGNELISSQSLNEYSEKKNIILYKGINIAIDCGNCLVINCLMSNADFIINSNAENSSSNETYTIEAKNEVYLNLFRNKDGLIIFKLSIDGIVYISENINKYISKIINSKNGKEVHILKEINLYKYNIANTINTPSVAFTFKLSMSKLMLDNISAENHDNTYLVIKLLPHFVFRNISSLPIKTNDNHTLSLSFIYNDICDQIKSTIINTTGNNNEDYIIYKKNKYDLTSQRESSFILNENKIKCIKLCLQYTDNSNNSDEVIYISQKIPIALKDNETKDFAVPFYYGKEDNENNINYYYFLFRIKNRIINDNILSITLSSFINFLFKKNITDFSFKNTLNNCDTSQNKKALIDVLCAYNKNNMKITNNNENENNDINIDSIFSFKAPIAKIVNLFDVMDFYTLLKSLNNTIDITINNNYSFKLNVKELYINETFQLISFCNNTTQLSGNENKKIHSKIYHKQMIHNPYFICEIYNDFYNIDKNTYIFIKNSTKENQSIYIHAKNSYIITEMELKPGIYELYSRNDIHTLILTLNKKDIDIIKNGTLLYNKLDKTFEGILYEKKVNVIYIKLHNDNNESKKSSDKKSDKEVLFSMFFNKVNIDMSLFPFFIPNSSKTEHPNYTITVYTEKLFLNYMYRKLINFSMANLFIWKRLDNDMHSILSTKYITDIKIESFRLFPEFTFNREDNSRGVYYKTLRINFPVETFIEIDGNLVQFFNFFIAQINTEEKHLQKIDNNNLSLLNCVILTKVKKITIIDEIKVNDFNLNMNIEYKKGLNFTIKNSKIKSQKQVMNNLIGNTNEIWEKVKNNFMKKFFLNIYSLFASTEIFGNFNDFIKSVKGGITKFKERPFTVGILNFVYDSVKGSVNSFVGIGRSLAKTIRHFRNRHHFDYEIYSSYNKIITEIDKNNKENNNLIVVDLKILSPFGRECFVNSFINEENENGNNNKDKEFYQFKFSFSVTINNQPMLLMCGKYFLCFCNNGGICEILLPYYMMSNYVVEKEKGKYLLRIIMKKGKNSFEVNNQKERNDFKIQFESFYDEEFVVNFLREKFIL